MLTEFTPTAEQCTAVITSHTESGDNYEGAISVGYYPGVLDEIWIEFKGTRMNIHLSNIDVVCRQLKRAARIAKESE